MRGDGLFLRAKCPELLTLLPTFIGSACIFLCLQVASMQKSAGMDQVFVDNSGSDSTVTVTGWVALACIISLILVIMGGSFMLYRRLIGEDKPHTLHVKMGDA
jgi:golgi apparatus protein 1